MMSRILRLLPDGIAVPTSVTKLKPNQNNKIQAWNKRAYICDETKTKLKQNQNNSKTTELPESPAFDCEQHFRIG